MNGRIIGWLRVHLQRIRQLGFLIACVSNWLIADLYVVLDSSSEMWPQKADIEPRGGWLTLPVLAITLLAIAQFFCCLLLFVFHLMLKSPHRLEELAQKNVQSPIAKTLSRLFQIDKQLALKGKVRINCRERPGAWLLYGCLSMWYICTEIELIYLALSVLAAILGMMQWHFFLAFHLLGTKLVCIT